MAHTNDADDRWCVRVELLPPPGAEDANQEQDFIIPLGRASAANVIPPSDTETKPHVIFGAKVSLNTMRIAVQRTESIPDGPLVTDANADMVEIDKLIPVMPHHRGGRLRFTGYRHLPRTATGRKLEFSGNPLWVSEMPYELRPPNFELDTPGPHWTIKDEARSLYACDLSVKALVDEEWELVGPEMPLTIALREEHMKGKAVPWIHMSLQKTVVKGTADQPIAFYIGRRYTLRRIALRITSAHFPKGFYDV